MEYSYKFRIYPDDKQKIQIDANFDICQYVYNIFLKKFIKTIGSRSA